MNKKVILSTLMISIFIPILSEAATLKATTKQQMPSQNNLPEKAYGNAEMQRQGPGPILGYGYGAIDKNIDANGYGYAFAYGHDEDREPNGNAYGLQKKEEYQYGYGYEYGKEIKENVIQQKKTTIFTNIFSRIKNIFSFWKIK